MTAMHAQGGSSGQEHRLVPGAQPGVIAAALLPGDRAHFLRSYERELRKAQSSLDLSALYAVVEQWRGVAAMQSRPEEYRRDMRRAAELITGEPSPEDEALEVTRRKAGA